MWQYAACFDSQYLLTPQARTQGGGVYWGAVPEKIKGNSFVGVAATTLKPLPSCYRVKWRGTSYRVVDMHMKFAKQFTHYLILFQELDSNKKNPQKKPP